MLKEITEALDALLYSLIILVAYLTFPALGDLLVSVILLVAVVHLMEPTTRTPEVLKHISQIFLATAIEFMIVFKTFPFLIGFSGIILTVVLLNQVVVAKEVETDVQN